MFNIPKHASEILATRFGKENRIVAAFLFLVLAIADRPCLVSA